MILYHFTSLHHWRHIRTQGLTKGAIPIQLPKGVMGMQPGFQWLTCETDWNQDWDVGSGLPYRRTELRLTVSIPNAMRNQVHDWERFSVKVKPDCREAFARFPSSKYWVLYHGPIPCGWILEHHRNPTPIDLSQNEFTH